MGRCLLVSNRVGEDKQTHADMLFMVAYKMPTVTSNGTLWYPKKEESMVNIVVRKDKDPMKYDALKGVKPGALIDVTFAVNDATGKVFVASYDVVPNTDKHDQKVLFLSPKSK